MSNLADYKTDIIMNKTLYKADSRGRAQNDWLKTNYSFSFANYYNPERMHFGVLRVLNDDVIAAGRGFGTHPHDNMEIITIPLKGELKHQDSMGNSSVIKQGEVQVMSAGSGIQHSEFNNNSDVDLELLQIWLFPNKKNVEPRYDEVSIKNVEKQNEFYQVLSPNKDDQGVWIYQNAYFHLGDFDKDTTSDYKFKSSENGLYIFVIEGSIKVANEVLNKRDALGVWNTDFLNFEFIEKTKVLLMEVPMR